MELEKSIKRLKLLLQDECECSECIKNKEAIKTVLQELESYKTRYELALEHNIKDYKNSVPKKKIEDKQKLIEMEEHYDYKITYTSKQVKEILQELLEE